MQEGKVLMRSNRILMVVFLMATAMVSAAVAVNPFRPQFCGECTDGAWNVWVEILKRKATPTRSARFWWDDAAKKGFNRSNTPGKPSIMVLDAWSGNSNGHVGVVTEVDAKWSPPFYLCWVLHTNWSPRTSGNCAAALQGNWFAYHPQSQAVWCWMGNGWSRSYPCRGFIR